MTESFVSFALGGFRFSVRQAAYERLSHRLTERWQAVERAGADAALQWAGHGEQTLEISGVVFPHVAGSLRLIAAMRAEARRAEPLRLVDGLGFFWGRWVMLSVEEDQSGHLMDGAPRRQDFRLSLRRAEAGGAA